MRNKGKNRKPNTRRDLSDESIQLSIIGGFFILVTILDFIGVFHNEKLKWIGEHFQAIILLYLALSIYVLSRLIVSSKNELATTFTSYEAGVEVSTFDNVGQVYAYIADKLKAAQSSIEDVTWGSYENYRTREEDRAYEKYVKAMEDVCKKGRVSYAEISSLSSAHYFKRAKNLLKHRNYQLRYHDISSIKVPLMSFIIIDSVEVILGFRRVMGVSQPPHEIIYMSITDPDIVSHYISYYNDLWITAQILKEGNTTYEERLNSIESKLNIKPNN